MTIIYEGETNVMSYAYGLFMEFYLLRKIIVSQQLIKLSESHHIGYIYDFLFIANEQLALVTEVSPVCTLQNIQKKNCCDSL